MSTAIRIHTLPGLRDCLRELEDRHAADHGALRRELSRISFRPDAAGDLRRRDPFSDGYRQSVEKLVEEIAQRPYDVSSEGLAQEDIANRIRWRTPYGQPADVVGPYLMAYGHLVQRMNLPRGGKVLELGAGEGGLSEVLARMGYDLTIVDVCPSSCEIIRGVVKGLDSANGPPRVVCADFSKMAFEERYDAVVFFESFHHIPDHARLLERLGDVLNPGGVLVFGAEPVQKRSEHLPYAWGPRLDGESLRAMMRFGWMELGFTPGYFFRLLHRLGFSWRRDRLGESGWSDVIVARRKSEAETDGFHFARVRAMLARYGRVARSLPRAVR